MLNVERYAFLDEKKKVKVYVELDGVGDHKVVALNFICSWFMLSIHRTTFLVISLRSFRNAECLASTFRA